MGRPEKLSLPMAAPAPHLVAGFEESVETALDARDAPAERELDLGDRLVGWFADIRPRPLAFGPRAVLLVAHACAVRDVVPYAVLNQIVPLLVLDTSLAELRAEGWIMWDGVNVTIMRRPVPLPLRAEAA